MNFFAVNLYVSSAISLYKTQDGACVASIEPGALPASMTPSVTSHGTGSQMPWTWKYIFVVSQFNVILFLFYIRMDADLPQSR